jgi:hypothetical protein
MQVNHQCRRIHDRCLILIILQAPVARDARFVTRVLDAIVDFELIGYYSRKDCDSGPQEAMEHAVADAGGSRKCRPKFAKYPPLSMAGAVKLTFDCFPRCVIRYGPQAKLCVRSCPGLRLKASDGTAHVDMTLFSKYLQRILRQVQRLADHVAGAAPLDRVQELIVGWSGTTGMPTVTTTPTPFGADMRTNT